VKLVETMMLIRTTLGRRGDGKDIPHRVITQFWTGDGELVAQIDPAIEAGCDDFLVIAIAHRLKAEELLTGVDAMQAAKIALATIRELVAL
jgi:hypothetical protein